MILFLQDWIKYPNAIVHTSTKNQSFIDLANIYKKMGIKNYYFHLQLHDRRLEFVDPYDPNLTQEQKIWIAAECAINPFYYFREIAPTPEGNLKNRFRANRANISLFWSFFNNCQYLLIQPRQTGKSYSTDVLMTYLLNFSTGLRMLLYTKDRPLAVKNVIRLRKLFERMPKWLNRMTKKDSNNQETITVLDRRNYYNTIVAQDSVEDADKKGRGDTVEIRHCDEIAYCKNNFITIPTMGSAMNAAKDDAMREGKFTGSIFTTTAGKKDSPEGKWAYELFTESAQWDEKYLDCKDVVEFEKMVRKDSNPQSEIAKITGTFSIQGTFSHRQMGYTDEWLINKIVENRVSPEAALRDYYNVWTSGNEVSPFTTKQLQMMTNSKMEPVYRDIGTNGLTVKWYYNQDEINHLMNNVPVIVGMDSSSNVGRDSTTLTFVNAINLEIIGCADCNNVNLYNYAQWLADLMIRYPKILIVPENKSSAQGIIDYLIEVLPSYNIDPFKRVFNIVVNERDSNPRRFDTMDSHPSRMSIANQYRPLFGYMTTGTGRYTRNNLYNETLYRAVDIVADKIKDSRLVDELLGLVVLDGRIDHLKGKHDDQVISWLLACWFIFNARNVFYYDIIKQRFLSDVVEAGTAVDPVKLAYNREQENIRNKIESLYNDLNNTDDYFEFSKIEKSIRLLEQRLNPEERNKIIGMSDMINELKENRKINMMKQSPIIVDNILGSLDSIRAEAMLGSRANYFGRNDMFGFGSYNANVDTTYSSDINSLDYWNSL